MNKVASGAEFAIFVLVKVAAHLFSQSRLVHLQLFKTMRKEAVIAIGAITRIGETSAKLKFAFFWSRCYFFIIHNLSSHDQYCIIRYIT